MSEKAILVVSFGTSYTDIIKTCIEPVEQAICRAVPDYDFYRAFTSGMIIRKLEKCSGIKIDTPQEAMRRLKASGCRRMIVQPTHILAGSEYHDLKVETEQFACENPDISISFGQPVLFENDDYRLAAEALQEYMPKTEAGEVVLLMGHGSAHFSNASYFALQHYLDALPTHAVYVANVEAPPVLGDVISRMKAEGIRKVFLMPFMLVAGEHAHHDMAGGDKSSWKNILEASGFEVEVLMKGLGQSRAFCSIYEEKVKRLL